MVYVMILGVMLGQFAFYATLQPTVRRLLWRFFTGRIGAAKTGLELAVYKKAAPAEPVELDVKDWGYVRKLEQESCGMHFHRMDGTCDLAGLEDEERAEREANQVWTRQQAAKVLANHRALAEREAIELPPWQDTRDFWSRALSDPDPQIPCHCDYCRGRAGVHGREAVDMHLAKVHALLDRMDDRRVPHPTDPLSCGCGREHAVRSPLSPYDGSVHYI